MQAGIHDKNQQDQMIQREAFNTAERSSRFDSLRNVDQILFPQKQHVYTGVF